MRRLLLIIGFGLTATGTALPDIINVSVDATRLGSGNVETPCAGPQPGCFQGFGGYYQFASYSMGGSTTELGSVSVGGSAQNTAGIVPGSVNAYASETTTSTPDSLAISLNAYDSGFGWGSVGSASGSVSVSFDLTAESLLQLTGMDFYSHTSFTQLLDSSGDTILSLQYGSGSASTVLQPGTYEMSAFASGSSSGQLSLFIYFGSQLTATFTPVVPEPRTSVFAALLAALLAGLWISRHRTRPTAHH